MDKYTLKTAFKKSFLGIVWRIEADTANNILAIETRDEATGNPSFSVFDYTTGTSLVHERPYGDRNWALAGTTDRKLIVRAFGHNSPDSAGIACIDATTGELLWEQFNYMLVGIGDQQLTVRHRNFASGYEQYIDIHTGNLTQADQPTDKPAGLAIVLPQRHIGNVPALLANYEIHGDIFCCPIGSKQVWAFHEVTHQKYRVRLVISNGLNVLSDEVVLTNLAHMIPELFFAIDRQLFLVSDNKREIVSYLV